MFCDSIILEIFLTKLQNCKKVEKVYARLRLPDSKLIGIRRKKVRKSSIEISAMNDTNDKNN